MVSKKVFNKPPPKVVKSAKVIAKEKRLIINKNSIKDYGIIINSNNDNDNNLIKTINKYIYYDDDKYVKKYNSINYKINIEPIDKKHKMLDTIFKDYILKIENKLINNDTIDKNIFIEDLNGYLIPFYHVYNLKNINMGKLCLYYYCNKCNIYSRLFEIHERDYITMDVIVCISENKHI